VTVGQFRRFVEQTGYRTEAERDGTGGNGWNEAIKKWERDPKYTWRNPGFTQADDHPVVDVSWNDAVAFGDWLSGQDGLKPFDHVHARGPWDGDGYRLPTEAEWEYACRAGTTTRYQGGDDPETLAQVGNIADGTFKAKLSGWTSAVTAQDGYVYTAPVGRFRANAFGLYDMHGNVWEWCLDGYEADYYKKAPGADPLSSSQAASRVSRGGSWDYLSRDVRSAYRARDAPVHRYSNVGFRVVRVLPSRLPTGSQVVKASDPPVIPPRSTPRISTITPSRDASAVAVPVRGITIDGDLKDWPVAMPRQSILKLLTGVGTYGSGELEHADLSTSPDLSVVFTAGYDLKEQLVYLAVIVRDDKLVVGNTSHLDTDAVEVYIDGLHSERRIPRPEGNPWSEKIDLSALPVQQYVAIPGPGKIYGSKSDTNPVLMAGDVRRTRTRMAFRREHDITTYEWAIQVFDVYPDRPTKLEPGKRIGFDLAVADRDVPASSLPGVIEPEKDRLDWIYWGPKWNGIKTLDAGNLGELILGDEP
jgi:formylglycine-generating enzyme required for sulfatase activity